MSVDNILKEINGVKRFMASRTSVKHAHDNTTQMSSFASALTTMISHCGDISPHDAAEITDALQTDSPYGEQGAASIIDVLDKKVDNPSPSKRGGKPKERPAQLLKCWWRYLTASDWTFLMDKAKPFSGKLTCLIERANSLGLVWYDEHTYRWMLALLLAMHYEVIPDARAIFNKLQELKQVRTIEKQAYPHSFLAAYPEDPSGLSRAMFNHAYRTEKPGPREIHGIAAIAQQIPLRANSVLLKNSRTKCTRLPSVESDRSDTPGCTAIQHTHNHQHQPRYA